VSKSALPLAKASPTYRDLSDWVVLRLLDSIRSGAMRPGQRLVERDIAERLGVSRAPVRDALHKLETLGVAERRSPRGICVRSWTDDDATEVVELTDTLILLSVQLAVNKLTEDDFESLSAVLEEAKHLSDDGPADPRRRLELDFRFHLIIARASGNKRVIQLLESLSLPMQLYAHETYEQLDIGFNTQIHTDLLNALRRRDEVAAIGSVFKNAPASRAVFSRALQSARDLRGAKAQPATGAQPALTGDGGSECLTGDGGSE
jgi:DNA-binding GntR family transcriptional regulator